MSSSPAATSPTGESHRRHHHLHAPAHHHHRRIDIHPQQQLINTSAILEQRIACQNNQIRSLLFNNQHLGATTISLKQELSAVHEELRHISAVSYQIKASRDAEIREVYDRSLRMEADIRSTDSLNSELNQVKSDIQKLNDSKSELISELRTVTDDLNRVRETQHQVFTLKAEIQHMQHQLQMGRAAIEYEKKAYAHNLERKQTMERNMVALSHEVEQLRIELADAEKRARASAVAAVNAGFVYARSHGNPGTEHGVQPYVDRYIVHQVHGVDSGVHNESGAVSHGSNDMQQIKENR